MTTGEDPHFGDQLVAELDALGVRFLWREGTAGDAGSMAPVRVLASLASSQEARLRLAIIPLLLHRPGLSVHVEAALQRLASHAAAQHVLKCYYMAACFLQQKYRLQLASLKENTLPLPDLFSEDLGLPMSTTPDEGLAELSRRQAEITGKPVNWQGTYEHAAERWISTLKNEQRWTA